jgi:hypothetical protein
MMHFCLSSWSVLLSGPLSPPLRTQPRGCQQQIGILQHILIMPLLGTAATARLLGDHMGDLGAACALPPQHQRAGANAPAMLSRRSGQAGDWW